MKYLLLILTFNFCFAQKIDDGALHFYSSVGICEAAYHTQKLLLPKQKEHNRFLISVGTSVAIGFSKEVFDSKRCNREKRTGFSKPDLAIDLWANLCWVPFRICINDWNKTHKKYDCRAN